MTDYDTRIKALEQQLRAAKLERRRATKGPCDGPGGALYWAIGGLIRDARVAAGISQAELARAIGASRTSIVNIEAGRQRLPIATLYDIADALGVEAVLLLPKNEDV